MSKETSIEEKVEEKPKEPEQLKIEEILIEGCASDEAKQVISQMLERRLTELDPTGEKAKFVMKLRDEVNSMPTCKTLIGPKEEAQTEN